MKFLPKAIILPALFGMMMACSESKTNSAESYLENGDYNKAVEEYTKVLEVKPADVKILYNRGRAYFELGEFDKARTDFESALDLEPNNSQVLLSLTSVQLEEKNFASALLYATKAEEIPGAPALASFLKGRALHQLGLAEEALKAYGNAIQLDRKYGQAYLNRGILKVAMDQTDLACDDFKLAAMLDYPGAKDSFDKYCK